METGNSAQGEVVLLIALFIYSKISGKRRQNEILEYIESVTFNVDAATKDTLLNMPLPMVIINMEDGKILWSNEGFLEITKDREHFFEVVITDVVPGFSQKWLFEGRDTCPDLIAMNGESFKVFGNMVRMDKPGVKPTYWGVLYWVNVSDHVALMDEYNASRPVMSLLVLDNYDELLKNLTDTAKSTLLASIDSRISDWVAGRNGYLCKFDRDRYIFIFEERWLQSFIDDKFSILDRVREIVNPSGIAATVSIGIGREGSSFEENYQFATLGIEMALSRGGDQVVVKNKLNFEFYGGHTVATERHTKVKSRVMANAMGELIADASRLIMMGHKFADLDCVGAAVGMCCIARNRGRDAFFVLEEDTNVAMNLVKRLMKLPEYENVFITPQDAMLMADSKTLLVVVDTNRPEQVESEQLLLSCNRVAVIDHHRRAATYIGNAALNFHEPYASSASELVTELMQYLIEPSNILKLEAEAVLAGIVLDTKNFTMRTGSRTFEAAAFLRRAGTDTTEVKRLFQSDLPSTIAKYRIIQSAKVYKKDIAIAVRDAQEDRVIAAKAADELLNILGITASFVIYYDRDIVNISARSIGDINVQFILEKLGGGGNKSMAGAQIKDKSEAEVVSSLLRAIDSYLDEE